MWKPLLISCLLCVVILAGTPVAGGMQSEADARPPNIVLIMADDMGFECLNSYGGTSYQTPELTRIASEGIQFDHCYSTPICTTSRVQLMTGKYNFRNYECFAYLNPQEKTFGHLLQRAGYATLVVGKWQLNGYNARPPKPGWDNKRRPLESGFDECYLWQVDGYKSERYWGTLLNENGDDQQLPARHVHARLSG